ncbi:uncharacterized protein LOC105282125 isoform X1 [Ooceraea biroi]|uniref:uncharacterized protein LOC105282125 isoform X1 n=2 Tax=Ooceraea biroi TaxID=2015173 RepID=UPI000F07ADFE|nr:uncharacterized protein LOC105282125 isoform X1 [Ooceraea biroi]
MDFDGSQYYKFTRVLLTHFGLWPYCTKRANCVRSIFLSPFLFAAFISQLSSFVTKEYSVDLLLNILSYACTSVYYILKYFGMVIRSNEIKHLMEQVQSDWNSLQNEEELRIIHRHTRNARDFITITITCFYLIILFVTVAFLWPNILNIVMPLNESRRSRQFPDAMEYFIDQEKYIYLLTFYSVVIAFVTVSVTLSIEAFGVLHIHHICAMFQIVSYRIECIVKKNEMKSLNVVPKQSNSFYKSIVEVVDSHQSVIEIVSNLKSSFDFVFLLSIPLAVISLSINLYRLCLYLKTHDIGIISLSGLFVISHFIYIFFSNNNCQKIIDYSDGVFKTLCSTRWYATPVYVQKYLLLIMCRSMKTSSILVGHIFVPSLQGYATVKRGNVQEVRKISIFVYKRHMFCFSLSVRLYHILW